jgi:hypothetical protein
MSGGAGKDVVDYELTGRAVTVKLDDRPNDGAPGERDDVRTDIEDVQGGGDEDTFDGSNVPNKLEGASGEDYVDGEGEADTLRGGSGRDVIRGRRDGRSDIVDCGRGVDFAIVDRRDRVRGNCERRDRGVGNRPDLGAEVVVEPRAGANQFGLPGMERTVPLEDRINLPLSSRVDANEGRVDVTSARNPADDEQDGTFYEGAFVVAQRESGLTELRLEGDLSGCRAGASKRGGKKSRRGRDRKLWSRTTGRFRTRGRASYATVTTRTRYNTHIAAASASPQTVWLTQDRCDGTLTRVRVGAVAVFDYGRGENVLVEAGESYLARR